MVVMQTEPCCDIGPDRVLSSHSAVGIAEVKACGGLVAVELSDWH